jgi:hypothetical protein
MHASATPLIHASFRYAPLRTNDRQTLSSNCAGKYRMPACTDVAARTRAVEGYFTN